MASRKQVWRAAPATLAVVIAFIAVTVTALPGLAYLIYDREQSWPVPAGLLVLTVAAVLYAWRFGLHPKIAADDSGVRVVNPFRTTRFGWEDITVLSPGENGLVVASPDRRVEAWCVQKSRSAIRRGRYTRADQVAAELTERADAMDPSPVAAEDEARIRRARPDEVRRLARMERATSEAALAHIFPPEDYPYPMEEITRRWRRLLRHPLVRIYVMDAYDAPVGYVAYDAERVRHLGVLPQQTGQGYGSLLLEHACTDLFGSGARQANAWVLMENTRAIQFLRERGWTETEERRECEFPPCPEELKMVRPNPSAARRGR